MRHGWLRGVKKLGTRHHSIHELCNSVCCILRYSIGRHAIQRCTLVRGSGFKMKNTTRSRNSTKWISSLQSREPTLGSAHYSHLQIHERKTQILVLSFVHFYRSFVHVSFVRSSFIHIMNTTIRCGQNGPALGVPLRILNNVLTSLISICFN